MTNNEITDKLAMKVKIRPIPKLQGGDRAKFWGKVDRRQYGQCWRWLGSKTTRGYGQFYITPHRVMFLAHRVMWAESGGEVEAGMFVLHKCDNPSCVNPTHLFTGTPKDNSRDMVQKGRSVKNDQGRRPAKETALRGESAPWAKLSNVDIREIRRLWRSTTLLQREIADKFGVCQSTISLVVLKKGWAHV